MRFVLLYHELPTSFDRQSHYDLMLQEGDCLLTWELPIAAFQSDGQCEACRLNDHRLEYLDFVGSLSGGRGVVHPVSAGNLLWKSELEDRPGIRRAILSLQNSSSWEIELREISESTWIVSWRCVG